jgi:pimeloyl-ACP methyl ester carboxylesterase
MNYAIHIFDEQSTGRDVICIGPGNGFPPGMYGPLADALGTDYHRVCLLPRPWWDTQVPDPFPNWRILADDLTAGIQQHELAPVIGIGHSMSGMAMLMAAAANPGLFRALILIDPIILPRMVYWTYPLFNMVGFHIRAKMISGALNRRREWPSVDDAYEHFRKASVFRRCSDEMVRLYAEGLTRPRTDGDGVELIYPPEWEAAIYNRSPAYSVWKHVRQLKIPLGLIVGAESDPFLQTTARYMAKIRPDFPIVSVPGTRHLVPFEEPEAVAAQARKLLTQIG